MTPVELRGMGKGANAPVNGNQCMVVVGSAGVDVVTFQLGADDRVRSDADVVFYNQPASPEGAVTLTGPGAVTVYLDLVPPSVTTVAIAVAATDDDRSAPLSCGLDVTLTTAVDGFRWTPAGLSTERAAILVELYRRNGTWKLRNVSAGWDQGLPALFTHFGVAVDDGADAPVPTITAPAPAAVRAAAAAIPAITPPVVEPVATPAAPAPTGKKRAVKKRIAWAAAVLVAVLVLAGLLGRKPDSDQNTAQPVLAAAPVMTASPTTSLSAMSSATSPATTPSTSSSSAPPAVSSTVRAEQLLAAPAPVPLVRTKAAAQAAVVVLQQLRVAGRAPKTGYTRAQFGQAWTDDAAVDSGHNGCDTRNDILRRDLRQVVVKAGSHGCSVTGGSLADPYTGSEMQFSSSHPDTVQIDHVVALSNAWQTGAAALSAQQRQDLANDPVNLQATTGPVNQSKGDGDAATWLPPDKSYRCTYVARQVEVKARYRLWVTTAERQAISKVLTGCGAAPATPLPAPLPTATRAPAPATTRAPSPATTRAPSTAAAIVPAPAPESTATTVSSTTTPAPEPTTVEQPPAHPITTEQPSTEETTPEETVAQGGGDVDYANCTEARAAGVTPLHRGDPGYADHLDRDHDGIACE